jgi:hypothetical protein
VEKECRIRHTIQISCWLNKARHTLKNCNTDLPMTTIVIQKPFNVALHMHCLCCFIINVATNTNTASHSYLLGYVNTSHLYVCLYIVWYVLRSLLLRDVNTLGTGDADLRFYRVLQSFVSFVTISKRVTQICVFTHGWIPRTLHLITQYMEPFFE